MKRSTVGLMFVLMLTVGTSTSAQTVAQEELSSLDVQLGEVAEGLGAVVAQYDRVLDQLGFPYGLDAWSDFDMVGVFASAEERLNTPERKSGVARLFTVGFGLLKIRNATRTTVPWLIDKLQQWWFNNRNDEAIISSIQAEVLRVQAILKGIEAELLDLRSVLLRIENALGTL